MITSVLKIKLKDKKTAKAVDIALSPDNINLPKGMSLDQLLDGSTLIIQLKVESPKQLNTLISTLDEIIAHADLATKLIEGRQN